MPKGGKQPGAGRPKGAVNKATVNAREAIASFVDGFAPRLTKLLDKIAEDDPKGAVDCFTKLVEYHIPKLARTELQPLDKDGKKASGFSIVVEHVTSDKPKS